MKIIVFILKYVFLKYLTKRHSYYYKKYIGYLYTREFNKNAKIYLHKPWDRLHR
jgi:hypothetical protein